MSVWCVYVTLKVFSEDKLCYFNTQWHVQKHHHTMDFVHKKKKKILDLRPL